MDKGTKRRLDKLVKGTPIYVAVQDIEFPASLAEALYAKLYRLKFIVPGGAFKLNEYIFEIEMR